jgi:succinate dehydrogenase / fumarate reductase flavoprotein subunit
MALDSKFQMVRFRTNYKKIIINLVNPANKRNLDVIVVGTGLAGGSASATLAELGYNVKSFVSKIHRVAHSIAAQGGINSKKTTKVTEIPFSDCFMRP